MNYFSYLSSLQTAKLKKQCIIRIVVSRLNIKILLDAFVGYVYILKRIHVSIKCNSLLTIMFVICVCNFTNEFKW